MFPRNCWYVAAHAHEISDALFARTFLNQAVILWRATDGKVAALEDRCPHRLVPLSTGKVVNSLVECGYHGLRFDAEGACAFVPGQDTVPKNARVKSFPVAERHGLIWIWMGAADLADEALIPDLHWMGSPGWRATTGYLHFNCDYRLVNDNLLDLSHETYIHKHTIGNDAVADSPVVTNVIGDRVVRSHREMPDIEPPPFFALAQGHDGRINRWQIAIYMAPGFNMTEVGFHAVGTDRVEHHLMMRPIHLITPETDHSSHYIWGLARKFRLDDDELNDRIYTATAQTFGEDRELLETQDRRLQDEDMPKIPQMAVKVDKAPIQGRRLLEAMIQREADDPSYCAVPIPLADDDLVTQPFAQAAE
jgi:phenylpropionate dioxygenase-like ring-hydroxylating dioxygenase large terminal subunit